MKNTGLKFLVDAGVGKNAEEYLIHKGYDTKTVRSINPHMEDEEILEIAFSEKRMVITADKDFGELVYHSAYDKTGENESRCFAVTPGRCRKGRKKAGRC